jgi:glycogen operon protein
LLGSAPEFDHRGRRTWASVNFVTAHDGFTLSDLWAYNEKHNEANLEDNKDGHDDNRSWNCGVEGPTNDPAILELRGKLRRATITTLLLSHGVPMLLAGDEIGRSQGGNNNAYCQDNEINWLDWSEDADQAFFDYVHAVIAVRRTRPLLRPAKFRHGHSVGDEGPADAVWLRFDGTEMNGDDWHNGHDSGIALVLSDRGQRSLLIVLNPGAEDAAFVFPAHLTAARWHCLIDSAAAAIEPRRPSATAGDKVKLVARSAYLFETDEILD